MDYLYGKLNKLVERQEYKGLTTDTAEVTVDNANSTIAVDVKYLPKYYEDLLNQIKTVLNVAYVRDIDIQTDDEDSNRVFLNVVNTNILLENDETHQEILPLASSEHAGLMSKEDYQEFEDLQQGFANLKNISDGEPDGSIQQKGSTALGDNDTALGTGNITGVKGYYIQKVRFLSESTQLLIGDTQVNPIEVANTELTPSSSFTVPLWDVGDEVCIIANYHYDFCAKITSIQNNLITLDKNLDGGYIGKVIADLNKEDNAIYVPTKPESGIISLLHSAAVTGFDNKAVGKASFASGAHNLAAGDYSHVEGRNNEAAYAGHAEGWKTSARGEYSHTEGIGTSATANCAHAEGQETKATKRAAHAEGYKTTASGELSHAEGYNTEASGHCSHTEGISTKASGTRSHAEGNETIASGDGSHAEGNKTKASGPNSHAEGGHDTTYTGEYGATASYTHAEGLDTLASAQGSHAEGLQAVASGQYAHAEGSGKATAWQSHAENNSTASGQQSHAEGAGIASGSRSHAENEARAEGANSHAEGSSDALAKGGYSHAEGGGKAYGTRSHAEGSGRTGQATGAAGAWEAHAEGAGVALGMQSHAEGSGTIASGAQSHAEGKSNTASGTASHAQGVGNTATAEGQFVAGRYSKEGQNGIGGTQTDNTMIVRIGAGKGPTDPLTVFSIDESGTTCMRCGAVVKEGITAPWHVINREYADNRYLGKSGGTVSGNVTIQGDLTVAGTTTTETEKQLLVEANVIATNANKQPLGALLSGLAINKNAKDTYGLMYDPSDDSVKFGQGTLDTNNQFVFSANEGHPIAIRDDSEKFTDGHFVKWQASSNSFVDAGVDENSYMPKSMFDSLHLVPSSAEYEPDKGISANGVYCWKDSSGNTETRGLYSTWPIYNGSGINFINGQDNKLKVTLDSEHTILFNNANSMFTEGMYVAVLENDKWAQTKATADATPDAVAKRDDAGNLKVGTPQNDSDATPKSYVVPKVNTANIVYGTGESGETKNIKYSTTPVASSIPVRTPTGTLQMADPTTDKDGVNLEYLNSKLPTTGGSQSATQTPLSSITYTPEASIPTSAVEGVEYACTDFIAEDDLDSNLQTKINSALTQTTADERYVKKSEQGGVEWKTYSALIPENKILMYEIHVGASGEGLDGWLYLRQLTSSYYSVSVSARGGAAGGVACMLFMQESGLWKASPTSAYIVAGTTISSVTTSNMTCTITRVLVNE